MGGPEPNATSLRILERLPYYLSLEGVRENSDASGDGKPVVDKGNAFRGNGGPPSAETATTSNASPESASDASTSASAGSDSDDEPLSFETLPNGDAKIDLHGLPV